MKKKYYNFYEAQGVHLKPLLPAILVVHPENIEFDVEDITIGPGTILEAYHKNKMTIGKGCWIGAGCFFHSAGGIKIGKNVGFGPGVKILTSEHRGDMSCPGVMETELTFSPVVIGDGADIGAGSIILPGVEIWEGAIVGAGSVVTKNTIIRKYQIWAGNPCRYLKDRNSNTSAAAFKVFNDECPLSEEDRLGLGKGRSREHG